jgi:hypothetical protein
MGIGDSIRKAAENAMKDLGGTAEPHDDGHLPEPGAPDEEIKVHSSISEGSNTREAAEDEAPGQDEARPGQARGPAQEAGTSGNILPGDGGPGVPGGSGTSAGAAQTGAAQTGEETAEPPRDVPGPGGLPEPDPDVLRADPTEGDKDPSTGMGRG